MGKVVYNACYGGFGLSRAATERLAAMGVVSAKDHLADPEAVRYDYYARDIPRHDPRLVRAVEEMGETANGQGADLRIADLGEGAHAYRIKEHDGQERVEEVYCDGVAFAPPADEKREQAVCIAREELTRLDAEAQRAAKEHETLVTAWVQAPENHRQRLFGRSIEDARFRESKAAGAFEGARRLAERLGLIGEGESEFFKEKK